jgi:endonuclease/exonuclease/phosphatase (EEP) superfamily protein YafD
LGEVSVVVAGLARLIRMYPSADRLILAGDINRTPWSFALRRLDRSLPLQRVDRAAFTWPARIGASDWPAAILPLDHVYAGSAWRLVNAGVGPSVGATHRPLVVDLEDCSER